VVVLVSFILYIVWSIYGAMHIKTGMKYSDLVLKDSYYYKFSTWEDGYYGKRHPIAFMVTKALDYAGEGETTMMTRRRRNGMMM
jgi:hypothetical protein